MKYPFQLFLLHFCPNFGYVFFGCEYLRIVTGNDRWLDLIVNILVFAALLKIEL